MVKTFKNQHWDFYLYFVAQRPRYFWFAHEGAQFIEVSKMPKIKNYKILNLFDPYEKGYVVGFTYVRQMVLTDGGEIVLEIKEKTDTEKMREEHNIYQWHDENI